MYILSVMYVIYINNNEDDIRKELFKAINWMKKP